MTEYTPSTDEVRERYIDGFPMDTWVVARGSLGEDFDRWLAEHTRQVAERAWAEGFVQATDFMDDPALPTPLNPYRKEATADWPPPKSRDEIRKGAIDEVAEALEGKEVTGD